MSKNAQALIIDPANELVFKGPFTDVVTCELTLRNPTERHVCFKVKTTAPKQYCVRPNSGIINPHEKSAVAVMLQPFDASAITDTERARHKFMVQSVYAPPGDINLETIWKTVHSSELMDSKLRVVFEQPGIAEVARESSTSVSSSEIPRATIPASSDRMEKDSGDLLHAFDDLKKTEAAKASLERENANLKARLAAVESLTQASAAGQPADNGIALLQVALMVLAALLVGLIFGKLF